METSSGGSRDLDVSMTQLTAEGISRHHKWFLQMPKAVNGIIAFSYYTYEPKSELTGITVRRQRVKQCTLTTKVD